MTSQDHNTDDRALFLWPRDCSILAVRVQNIDAISVSFGVEAANQVSEAVYASLHAIFDEGDFDGSVTQRACGAFDLVIEQTWTGAARLDAAESVFQRLDRWCRDALLTIHNVGGGAILAAIALRKTQAFAGRSPAVSELDKAHAALSLGATPTSKIRLDDDTFAREMGLAVDWAEDYVGENLAFSWVPARSLQADAKIAHFHGRLCGMSSTGAVLDPARRQAAMARVGLGSALDLAVLDRAVAAAARASGPPLMVDISASTLQSSFWQISLLLGTMKDGQRERLRIQIIPDLGGEDQYVASGIAELHRLGIKLGVEICQSAALHRNLMLSIEPEFVSIAPMFMRSVLVRPGNIEAVSTVHALARLIAPIVVMQGIDTLLLAEQARCAGVIWGEGEHLGVPSWQTPRSFAYAYAYADRDLG